MFRSPLRRASAIAAVSALSVGLVSTGAAITSAGASGNDGVTSNSITIGATVPLTGIASPGYSDVAKAARAAFKYINGKGGINGRQINFIIKDDCYEVPGFGCTGTPSTYSQTQALLNTPGGLFATTGSLGTATQDSVRSLLDNNNVPQLFVNSGSSDWNNVGQYPRLFGWQTDYIAEGKIFANYIKTNFKNKSVGFIGQNDDFGANGLTGLNRGGLSIPAMGTGDSFSYEATAAVAGNPFGAMMAKMKNDKVAVVVLDSIPVATKNIIQDAHAIGFKPQFVISGVGSDPQTVNNKYEVGALSLTFLPPTSDTKNVWNAWTKKVLLADNADFPKFTAKSILTGNMQYGVGWAVTFMQALRLMGTNPTQSGIVNVLETQGSSFATPAVTSLKYSASNHQGLQGGLMVKISSATATTSITKAGTVYSAGDAGTAAPTTTKYISSAVPSWLA